VRAVVVILLTAHLIWAEITAVVGSEFVQNATSAKALTEVEKIKTHARESLNRQIEDLHRILHLDEARMDMLRLAVEGELENQLSNARDYLTRDIEARLKGVNSRNVAKLLAAYHNNTSMTMRSDQDVWTGALRQTLTSAELARWEKLKAERLAYRCRAIARLLRSIVVERVGLNDEQMGKLTPLLEVTIADYLPDMLQQYSDGNERRIYSEYVRVFTMGVPEKAARAIITDPEKWKLWEQVPGDYRSSWGWIKQNHDQRVKGKQP
jgi:hypothetical protein